MFSTVMFSKTFTVIDTKNLLFNSNSNIDIKKLKCKNYHQSENIKQTPKSILQKAETVFCI